MMKQDPCPTEMNDNHLPKNDDDRAMQPHDSAVVGDDIPVLGRVVEAKQPDRVARTSYQSHTTPVPPGGWTPGVAVALLGLLFFANILAALFIWLLLGFAPMAVGALAKCGISIVVVGVVAPGMVTRDRLAWQWVRVSSVLGIVGMIGSLALGLVGTIALMRVTQGEVFLAPFIIGFWVDGLRLLLLIALYIVTGSAAARDHFGLRCPRCGSFTIRGKDLLFRRAECKNCLTEWPGTGS